MFSHRISSLSGLGPIPARPSSFQLSKRSPPESPPGEHGQPALRGR
ncbi:hypothetical protein N177_2647 [Lutibaculum baratangense AMV1]|uniref:Uncharacterized protein n=1 Tax=Lutibaculum baratangense AMV1 TaxID=631454 RepID=V4TD16_9HYPH|nr:hypothetical protein N177_2647 [Lutibaculum baratangense AMV1]